MIPPCEFRRHAGCRDAQFRLNAGLQPGREGQKLVGGYVGTPPEEDTVPTKSRIWIVLASVLGCLLLFSSEAQPAGEQPLGRIVYSNATSLRGVAVPKSETILSGDVLATSDDGSALVELKSGAKLKITENSSVRFLGDGDKVQAELLAGAVVSESAGKPTLVVTTSKYHFAPSQEGNCRFAVVLSKQQETVAAAMMGNLLIRTPDSLGSYLLPEGKYAAIPAATDGVPAQEKTGGVPVSAGQAGTVANEIPQEVLQRQGQGAEIPLKVSDGINQDDLVRTLKTGRVRIALLDGSFLNIGARSVMKITKQDAQTQQTQIELKLGLLRAEVVKRTKPEGSFKVQTQTAVIGVVGSVLLVQALPNLTRVHCVEGLCSVQNINPAITGQVILHAGESTVVNVGAAPAAATATSATQIASLTHLTTVGGAGHAAAAAGIAGLHIGALSTTSSIILASAIAAGVTAAIAVPVITSGPAAPAAPVSPSAP
jgi:hypothetical protein